MHKLFTSLKKETLLLIRDLGGVLILFVMPIVLVITITLLQDSTFKKVSGTTIDILLIDQDQGRLSNKIKESFDEIPFLNPITVLDGNPLSENNAKELVASGEYQLAVVIPAKLSIDLDSQINSNINKILAEFEGSSEIETIEKVNEVVKPKTITFYFDPVTQQTFRSSVAFAVDKLISQIETESIYKAFEKELGESESVTSLNQKKLVTFKEINPSLSGNEIIPNSVQHNVPAWTLFAIFFMILPLSLNVVKEKNQGTFVRLQTTPIKYQTILTAKAILYVIVSLIQFTLILLIGRFLFPYVGLPVLSIGNAMGVLYVVTLAAGMAAVGLGLFLGTVFNTHEQAAPFGSVLVVILAAIGGVWIPVFAMPDFMRMVAKISPMNWGLEAYYNCFIREGSVIDVMPQIGLLVIFSLVMIGAAIIYYEKKRKI